MERMCVKVLGGCLSRGKLEGSLGEELRACRLKSIGKSEGRSR